MLGLHRVPYCGNSNDQLLGRFFVRVLWDKLALDGEREDGFAEVGGEDVVGLVENEIEFCRCGRVGKAGQ